ncbi:MAG: sterol desaturase family protein [Pseudomonadota bacterium]
MSDQPYNPTGDYQPGSTVEPPVIYAWPPKPLAAMRYMLVDMMFPWNYLYIGLALICWAYFTPSLSSTTHFEFGWIAELWVRNAAVLTLVAGGLHWWLYQRKSQQQELKFHRRWLDTDNDKFLWRNQVYDNVFWSCVSGVTIATAYEAMTYWLYANGYVVAPDFAGHPVYLIISIYGVFFLGTAHFYCIHRLSHWPPLYRVSHELHHRNVNTGPWTGISMHPIEHLLYFNAIALTWIFPVHPFVVVLITLWFIAGPAPSHCGFDFIRIRNFRFSTGDWFHQLHHQYFDLNYGNTLSPLDCLFGSWHNGSKDSLMVQKHRAKTRRKSKAGAAS